MPHPIAHPFSIPKLILSIYLPGLLAQTAVGALIPIIPHANTLLGGTIALAAVFTTLLPIAGASFDIPANALLDRWGTRPTLIVASLILTAGLVIAALGRSLWLFAIAIVLIGVANVFIIMAQQVLLARVARPSRKALAMSMLGALGSIGAIVGSVLGAAIISGGTFWAVPWFCAGAALLAAVVFGLAPGLAARDIATVPEKAPTPPAGGDGAKAPAVRTIFLTLGIAMLLAAAVRGLPKYGLPIWTEHLEFDPAVTSLIYAVLNGCVLGLTPVAAWIMRTYGRLLPALLMLVGVAAGLAMLPFTTTPTEVLVSTVLMGCAMGSAVGLMMTIGSDVKPAGAHDFTGHWRVLMDGGSAITPALLSALSAAGLTWLGMLGGAIIAIPAAILVAVYLPRYTAQASRRTRRRAGLPVNVG